MEFGEILKSLREEKQLSRDDLSKDLAISYSAISKYETNVRFPDKETLTKIADYFNVSVDYLLGRTSIRNFEESTIATHRTDGYDVDLPPEAQKQLKDYIELLYFKYGKK